MIFRRKPIRVLVIRWEGRDRFPWKVYCGGNELSNHTFKQEYEPVDAEARAKWKEVYGEDYQNER